MWQFAFVFMGLAASPSADQEFDVSNVMGRWMTHDKASIIEIKDCGDETPCGIVTWIAPHADPDALDSKNKEESMRSRPILGLQMLYGFEAHKKGWRSGSIYNPEDGRTYRSNIKRLPDGNLKIQGCLGPICKSHVWAPAPDGSSELDNDYSAAQ